MKRKSGSVWVVLAAMIGNGLIAITKFIAVGITGSSAMLSEAVHSVVDTGNQGLLLWGMNRASRPADERHPFGYGMEPLFLGVRGRHSDFRHRRRRFALRGHPQTAGAEAGAIPGCQLRGAGHRHDL